MKRNPAPPGFTLDLLAEAARNNRRCPTQAQVREAAHAAGYTGVPIRSTIPELAYMGKCKVEVYGKNYRVVEIEGERTRAAPAGHKPYLVISKDNREERHGQGRW